MTADEWMADCEHIVDGDGQLIALLRFEESGCLAYTPFGDGGKVAWAYHGTYLDRAVALAWLGVK